jgi:hypothetical protein
MTFIIIFILAVLSVAIAGEINGNSEVGKWERKIVKDDYERYLKRVKEKNLNK